jgi:hypothetical protein
MTRRVSLTVRRRRASSPPPPQGRERASAPAAVHTPAAAPGWPGAGAASPPDRNAEPPSPQAWVVSISPRFRRRGRSRETSRRSRRSPDRQSIRVKPNRRSCAALARKRTFAADTMDDGNAQIAVIRDGVANGSNRANDSRDFWGESTSPEALLAHSGPWRLRPISLRRLLCSATAQPSRSLEAAVACRESFKEML